MYYVLVLTVLVGLSGTPEAVYEKEMFEFLTEESCVEVGDVTIAALARDVENSEDEMVRGLGFTFKYECVAKE